MWKCVKKVCISDIGGIHVFLCKNNFYKKMSLKNLKKMLRKSPASNAWVAILPRALQMLENWVNFSIFCVQLDTPVYIYVRKKPLLLVLNLTK